MARKDISKLTKKVITDKRGKRTTVWVKTSKKVKTKAKNSPVNVYEKSLGDLKTAIKEKHFHNEDMEKIYYQNALKYGLKEKFIDNKTRLAINRHNKKLGLAGLGGGDKYRDHLVAGVDIVIAHIKKKQNA